MRFKVSAIECLLDECPEKVLPRVRELVVGEYLWSVSLPYWCQVWQHLVSVDFLWAAHLFATLFQQAQGEAVRLHLDFAWEALVDAAITAPAENRQDHCNLLSTVPEMTAGPSHDVPQEQRELLPASIISAASQHCPDVLPALFRELSDDFHLFIDQGAIRALLSCGEDGMLCLQKAAKRSPEGDRTFARALFYEYVVQRPTENPEKTIEAFFKFYPSIERGETILDSIPGLSSRLSFETLLGIVGCIPDRTCSFVARAILLEQSDGIPPTERSSLFKETTGFMLSNIEALQIQETILLSLCRAAEFLSPAEAENWCSATLKTIEERNWPLRSIRAVGSLMTSVLARMDLETAMRFSLSLDVFNSFGLLTHVLARRDQSKAQEFAELCIDKLSSSQAREIVVENDLKDCPEYLAWILEDPKHQTADHLDRLYFESLHEVRAQAKHVPLRALSLAATCCEHPLTRDRVISEVVWEYLDRMTEEAIRWIAEDAQDVVVSVGANRIVGAVAERFPDYALKIISRCGDPSLFADLTGDGTTLSGALRESMREVASEMLHEHRSQYNDLDERQVRDALRVVLLDAPHPDVYAWVYWIAREDPKVIIECLPVLIDALVASAPSPRKTIELLLSGALPQ